ncbi:MAG: tyrosine-type recombinase/integrase [Eubacteriales bacterium]|nr:tyrosine-type recombinase/integrase [Eubacteriales bacterium]
MATNKNTYTEQQNKKYVRQINDILSYLPDFCTEYFNSLEFTKQPRTRVAYALDVKSFFEYLLDKLPQFKNYTMKDFTLRDLEKLKGQDISNYLRYIRVYERNGQEVTNSEAAIKRKLCSLRRFYGYYYRYEFISADPTRQVEMPKLHEKAIIRMDPNEVSEFLDNVESGNKLTKKQLDSHTKLKKRDLALLTLMLGTGIRVSECVGLDVTDIDFDNERIRVIRKGGAESFVYFGDEVRKALLDYLEERKSLNPEPGHENALFISNKNKRLCVRSVELLVKKYAQTVTTVKHITPHKLRSTYGTNLYQESKDIYLVANVLGHKDVNTTRKHYAEIEEENKRDARNIVKLRSENI